MILNVKGNGDDEAINDHQSQSYIPLSTIGGVKKNDTYYFKVGKIWNKIKIKDIENVKYK